MRNMHVWPYCVSDGIVWFSDSFAGGLYTYNFESGEVCCIIEANILFDYGIFEVITLACWKSFVFIFSEKLNGPHIVYDNLKNEIKIYEGLESEENDSLHQALVIGEILYLIPLVMRGYIYIVNMNIREESRCSIKFVSKKFGESLQIKTWLPKCYGQSIYIPEYEGKRVFCITNDQIKIINLEIPSVLCTIGILGEELWVAPLYGKQVFCFTLEGKIKEKVEIPYDSANGERCDVWEIVLNSEYVFFVHWQKPEIDIYIRKRKEIIQISGKGTELPCEGGPGDKQYYLPYIVKDGTIRFLPSRCSMLEIDLSNFKYRQKKFDLPKSISDKKWENWCEKISRYRYGQKTCLSETAGANVRIFLKNVFEVLPQQNNVNSISGSIGMEIYQYILKSIHLKDNDIDE